MKNSRSPKKDLVVKKPVEKSRQFTQKEIQQLVDSDQAFDDVSHVDTGQAGV